MLKKGVNKTEGNSKIENKLEMPWLKQNGKTIVYIVINGTKLLFKCARRTFRLHKLISSKNSSKTKQLQSWRAVMT